MAKRPKSHFFHGFYVFESAYKVLTKFNSVVAPKLFQKILMLWFPLAAGNHLAFFPSLNWHPNRDGQSPNSGTKLTMRVTKDL